MWRDGALELGDGERELHREQLERDAGDDEDLDEQLEDDSDDDVDDQVELDAESGWIRGSAASPEKTTALAGLRSDDLHLTQGWGTPWLSR